MKDYIGLFNAHDEEMERRFEEFCDDRPKCECCGEVILDDFATCIDDEWFCNDNECRTVAMEAMWDKYKKQHEVCVA